MRIKEKINNAKKFLKNGENKTNLKNGMNLLNEIISTEEFKTLTPEEKAKCYFDLISSSLLSNDTAKDVIAGYFQKLSALLKSIGNTTPDAIAKKIIHLFYAVDIKDFNLSANLIQLLEKSNISSVINIENIEEKLTKIINKLASPQKADDLYKNKAYENFVSYCEQTILLNNFHFSYFQEKIKQSKDKKNEKNSGEIDIKSITNEIKNRISNIHKKLHAYYKEIEKNEKKTFLHYQNMNFYSSKISDNFSIQNQPSSSVPNKGEIEIGANIFFKFKINETSEKITTETENNETQKNVNFLNSSDGYKTENDDEKYPEENIKIPSKKRKNFFNDTTTILPKPLSNSSNIASFAEIIKNLKNAITQKSERESVSKEILGGINDLQKMLLENKKISNHRLFRNDLIKDVINIKPKDLENQSDDNLKMLCEFITNKILQILWEKNEKIQDTVKHLEKEINSLNEMEFSDSDNGSDNAAEKTVIDLTNTNNVNNGSTIQATDESIKSNEFRSHKI